MKISFDIMRDLQKLWVSIFNRNVYKLEIALNRQNMEEGGLFLIKHNKDDQYYKCKNVCACMFIKPLV